MPDATGLMPAPAGRLRANLPRAPRPVRPSISPTAPAGSAERGAAALGKAIHNLEGMRDLTFTGGSAELARAVRSGQVLRETSRLLAAAGDELEAAAPGAAELGIALGRAALASEELAGRLPAYVADPALGQEVGATRFVDEVLDHARAALAVLEPGTATSPAPGLQLWLARICIGSRYELASVRPIITSGREYGGSCR